MSPGVEIVESFLFSIERKKEKKRLRITETAPLSVSVHPVDGFAWTSPRVDYVRPRIHRKRDGNKALGTILPFLKISNGSLLLKKKERKKREKKRSWDREG